MSLTVEARVISESAKITAELLKEWADLRQTKKAEELNTPEWKKTRKCLCSAPFVEISVPKTRFWSTNSGKLDYYFHRFSPSCVWHCLFIQLNYAITVGDFSSLNTEVEVNAAGRVAISSSVIGAVMLVVSLAFFALYLKYVFQIKHTHPPHISLSDTDAKVILEKAKFEEL